MRIRRGMACAAVFSLFSAGLVAAPTNAFGADAQPIAAIQGTGAETPLADQEVTTTPSYVTAVYGTTKDDFRGFVIQSPDTGEEKDLTTGSDAIFVYMGAADFSVEMGDLVTVTGTAGEYNGLTQIAGDVTITPSDETDLVAPTPVTTAWADTAENRENLESMLYQGTESFLVSDTYPLLSYGELGLSAGGELPVQPTDVGTPDSAEAEAQAATNAATMVNLDDGTNAQFTGESHLPWITPEQDVTVGDSLTLTEPVIVDYRNDKWKLNPTRAITAGEEPGEITSTGTPDAPAPGGDFSVASFNVLNYFTTTGEGRTDCTDANGDGNATWDCDVRGAWDGDDLARQQSKIVTAINDLDASVVGLMEIENSAVLGEDADEATQTLVDALNASAGSDKWEVVPTSAQLQEAGHDDVITNALIFQPGKVDLNGEAQALADDAFANARTPIAASFTAADGGEPTLVAVNHFKSKGSGDGATGDNEETDDGQGAWNGDRKRQAQALIDWLPTLEEEAGTESAVLLGDFNSYSQEDPMQVLYEAGFTNAAPHDQYSYNYSGLAGSLDHVLVNESAEARMTGGDVWNINAGESTALEYSQYGVTADDYHDDSARRSSDHDPVIIGLEAGDEGEVPTPGDDTLTLLNINDFHGRIAPEEPDTVAFFGTVAEQEAAAGEDKSLFLSAGDNIGASLFASSIQEDEPTIDVLNAAGLDSSAVGNHEFDKGMDDLTGRVADRADWEYTGANVYEKDNPETPALEQYTLHEVDGRTVAVIGTVTEETASLVSPKGIADITFGDPVDAVNRVSAELSDGDNANGEADVIIAEYHEGAVEGQPGGTLEKEVAKGGAFAKIVNETSAEVDAIFTGHTHQTYAWDAPIPENEGQTRPIVQTGSYGENLGKVTLTLGADGEVTAYTAENLEVTETPKDELIDTYPQVKEINDIVNEALAAAEELGKPVIGQATAPITRAEIRGEDPETGETTDLEDRAGESTISNVVADMFRDQIDGADIGVQNPGGNREDLDEGDITFGEAASVLPFANTLNTVELTGAQFKTVLEQQWQVDENGDPSEGSRPYLQLGLSDNVSYTYDESQAWGERITSITIDGKPFDPKATYTVGTASFLASGGDNFWAFGEGANKKDTGKIDLDSWTDWIKENKTITPSFARRAVAVDPLPSTLTAGETTTVQVGTTERATGGPNNTLDLTSQESVENTELTATLDGAEIGTAEVTDGAAELDLAVPSDATEGSAELLLTAAPSETVVTLEVTVEGADAGDEPTVTVSSDKAAAGDDVAVQVSGWPGYTEVQLELHSEPVELRTILTDGAGRGTGTVTIPEDTTPGSHELVATAGDDEARATITITAADGGGSGSGGDGSGPGGLADTGATGALLAALLLGLGALGVGGLLLGTRKARA